MDTSKKFRKKTKKSLKVPKNLKEKTLWDFFNIHSVAEYQKIEGGPLGTFKNFRKSRTLKKGEGLKVTKNVERGDLLLLNASKKLAHTQRFENESSGLKSKNLTRLRTPEVCDLPAKTSCRAEKSTRTFS